MVEQERLGHLVRVAKLEDVAYSEIQGRNQNGGDLEEFSPSFVISLEARHEPAPGFRVLLECRADSDPDMQLVVGARATYSVPTEERDLLEEQDVLESFVNEVAIMTLLPFVREGLADLALRVFRTPIIMPMFPRGALRLDSSKNPT